MANLSLYAIKAMIDWALGGATPSQPTTWAVGLSLGVPTNASGSELTTDAGYTRELIGFSPAVSPAGSVLNNTAATFGPFSNTNTITGLQVWDTNLLSNSGNMLMFGTLATKPLVGPGDMLVIGTNDMTATLA